jgi:hypothetical protein
MSPQPGENTKRRMRMSHPSISRELQPLVKPHGRHVGSEKLSSSLTATITNPDILLVIVFSLIGIVLTLTFMLRFPDLGALIVQYNQF